MKTAYPRYQGTIQIRLYSNIPFDNTYQHHSLISNRFTYDDVDIYLKGGDTIAKEQFINRKNWSVTGHPYYYPRYDLTGEFNFDYSNGLLCSVVLELTADQTNANYMRIYSHNTNGGEYYYYFITGIQQLNVDTYKLSLELDVLMTYQNEFLDGIKNIPVMTTRKHSHRFTSNGLMPCGADLKTGEDGFSNVKPSLVKPHIPLSYNDSNLKKIEGIMWLYVCVDAFPTSEDATLSDYIKKNGLYTNNGKTYPLSIMCVPLNVASITYSYYDSFLERDVSITYSRDDINKGVRKLINDGKIHGAKISPYPPFIEVNTSITTTGTGNNRNVTITSSGNVLLTTTYGIIYKFICGNNNFIGGDITSEHQIYTDLGVLGELIFSHGFLLISNQDSCNYAYEDITSLLGFYNASAPSVTSSRYLDPKLYFSPFRKYKINAQYSGEGNEFYPELLFSDNATTTTGKYFGFETIATGFIGDNNFYTRIKSANTTVFDNYKYDKIGLSCSVNYIFPCGTNALDVFNSTQANTFYQSKIATGITSGITIAGGVGSIIAGLGMTVGSSGALTPTGVAMVAGGATAIAGGLAGEITNAKSITSKIEDLKNTPNSINISGSNFITDDNILKDTTNGLPYIVIYDTTMSIKNSANDLFYNYGYQVGRECYFNTELKYDFEDNGIDNNMFGRTIFNYIKINEDITNKINADMPQIIKQKISSVLNNGVTLWSFFGFDELWKNDNEPSSTYYIDKWFMKCKLDNTEYAN